MKKYSIIIAIVTISLLLINCKRSRYACSCTGTHPLSKDYGTHPVRQKDGYEKECKANEVDAGTHCTLMTNW